MVEGIKWNDLIPPSGPTVDDEFFPFPPGLNFDLCMVSIQDYDTFTLQS